MCSINIKVFIPRHFNIIPTFLTLWKFVLILSFSNNYLKHHPYTHTKDCVTYWMFFGRRQHFRKILTQLSSPLNFLWEIFLGSDSFLMITKMFSVDQIDSINLNFKDFHHLKCETQSKISPTVDRSSENQY